MMSSLRVQSSDASATARIPGGTAKQRRALLAASAPAPTGYVLTAQRVQDILAVESELLDSEPKT
jgi:hypothetical protein